MEIKMRAVCFFGSGGACVRKWVWLWCGHVFFFFFATVSSGFALWDVMLPGLTFLLAADRMQISGRAPRRRVGLGGGGSVIRADRSCRVWRSLYRCQKRQTVWHPSQGLQKSSLKQRTGGGGGWRVTRKLSPEPPSPPCVYKTIQRFW